MDVLNAESHYTPDPAWLPDEACPGEKDCEMQLKAPNKASKLTFELGSHCS